ncbi:MAG: PhoH family protein [Opitutales bacterium]|nr:PhoH family protein [Opitutales bacterium]
MMEKELAFPSARLLSSLYKDSAENVEMAEKSFGVKMVTRGDWLKIEAPCEKPLERACAFFKALESASARGISVSQTDYERILKNAGSENFEAFLELYSKPAVLALRRKSIAAKNLSQKSYLKTIEENEIVFGIGPAGTGKTYLAVAAALKALQDRKIEKIILTRPAVEAGEALGFLPGDLQEKLQPYLRPLYDAMFDMLGQEDAQKVMEKRIVEIAPLAYMRGRTLSNAFIILDEAQNTTTEQMMMFLTRLGENSRMIITGDITQIDLPRNKKSGLKDAMRILSGIKGIEFFNFLKTDVVRHRLVTKIVEAYERAQKAEESHDSQGTH